VTANLPPGFIFHHANAYETTGAGGVPSVVLDAVGYDRIDFEFESPEVTCLTTPAALMCTK
jgi:carotenoid cleavage dioxygenase-like enzyme